MTGSAEKLTSAARRFAIWRREGVPPARLGWALWIAALVAVAIPDSSLGVKPYHGLDQGWQTGLDLARLKGFHWGPEIDFTYGPLGFLANPKAFSAGSLVFSLAYIAVVLALFFSVLVWQLSRRYGAAVAVAGSFIVFSLYPGDATQMAVLAAVAVGLSALSGELAPGIARWTAALFGAATALQLLVKTDTGLSIGALGLIVVLFGPRLWRRLLEFVAAFVAVFVIAWLSLGQSLADAPVWARRSLSIVSGYASAMGSEAAGHHWENTVAAGLSIAVLLLAVVALRLDPGRKSWPVLLFTVFAGWLFFKSGFIRHDAHSIRFFFFVIVLILALPWRHSWRGPAALAFVIACSVLLSATAQAPQSWLQLRSSYPELVEELHAAYSPAERARLLDEARASYRQSVPIGGKLLRLVGNQPVQVDSNETTAAWAYDLNWRPVPIFQSYSAYTHELDLANAERLTALNGPTRVLRESGQAIDGRSALEEDPEYTLALVCNFVQTGARAPWQVLARVPDRCGSERKLSDAPLRNGVLVTVPKPSSANMIVVGRIGLEPSFNWRLSNLLYKPPTSSLLLDDTSWRLVPDTAGGPTLLRLPPALGWSPELGQTIDTNRIGLDNYSGSARITFYELPIRRS